MTFKENVHTVRNVDNHVSYTRKKILKIVKQNLQISWNIDNHARGREKKICKENLFIARNSDNSEGDIGKKILINFKESLHSAFGKKRVNFAHYFLATPKLSWN